MEKQICKYCNKEFEKSKPSQLFCDDSCLNKYHGEKKQKAGQETRNCLWCGNKFVINYHNHKFCSVECRDAGYAAIDPLRTAYKKEINRKTIQKH